MTHAVAHLLETFDHLTERERHQAASVILRRVRDLELDPVSDQELVEAADELFLELDRREAADESAEPR